MFEKFVDKFGGVGEFFFIFYFLLKVVIGMFK